MIQIIKMGKIPKKKIEYYRCECPNCATVFEFRLDDCYSLTRGIYADSIGKIKCPLCKQDVDIFKSDLFRSEEVDEVSVPFQP